jgi:hypothetical protein
MTESVFLIGLSGVLVAGAAFGLAIGFMTNRPVRWMIAGAILAPLGVLAYAIMGWIIQPVV